MSLKIIFSICSMILNIHFQNTSIYGIWKIRSYDVIDKIKQSPAYLFGDENGRKILDRQFEEVLSRGEYIFGNDTLWYTDIQNNKLIQRRAFWKIDGNNLQIIEIDRRFDREAYIHKLNADTLIISPIIEGDLGKSKILFTKSN